MSFDSKKITESKVVKPLILGIIILAICFGIFQAGVFVGFHKASFLFKFGDNYYRVFGERGKINGGMEGMGMFRDEFSGGHGAHGKIVKIDLPTFVVIGPDNVEKIILTSSSTVVRTMRDASSVNNLSVDESVTVLGTPNDQGQIVAKLIRILPVATK